MNYELAKELKEVGFPQFGTKWAWAPVAQSEKDDLGRPKWKEQIVPNDFQADIEFIAAPTLEELIEACGEGFEQLQRDYQGVPFGAPGKWLACQTPDRGETSDCVVGDSATEAVAHLWLALNKK